MLWISSAIGALGNAFGGFFGFKRAQIDAVNKAVGAIGDAQHSDSEYARAASNAIGDLYTAGPPIERLWRPALMWIIIIMIIARWFGFVPPHITNEEVTLIYSWLEIGLIGYIPLRSLDKWMKGFQIGSVLKTLIEKKLG